MIHEPGDVNRDITVTETFHLQTDDELSDKELKQIEADDQVIQTILLGLLEDIYAAVDSCETAQEIWLRVQQMMKGSDIGIQEKKDKNKHFPEKIVKEYDLMADVADLDKIEEVNANCILMANLQQASTSDDELSDKELKQIEADDQVIQTILLGLLEDIYAVVDSCETAQEIWLRVHQMMKGSDIRIQEKKDKIAKTQDPLTLMAKSNNPYTFSAPHQDQSSFNQNYLQQPMPNPEDITDLTTAMNMALALMAKAFKLNYSTPTNNNQRISSNPRNRQIAQPGMNMGQDRQMQMIGGNGGNQFRQYAGNPAGYNDVIRNQNRIGNGNLVAARAEGNAAGQNRNQIRCYNCRGVEEYDLMADVADLDKIEEVNANCILMANLQQASTLGTQTESAPVYDTDGSAEALSREELYFSNNSKKANVSKSFLIPNEDLSDDTTPSVARKFLNEVKSTILTLQRVVKQRMTIETHNWASSAHQELHKIEEAKLVGDFKSLANEADASLAKLKAMELEIEHLLKAIDTSENTTFSKQPIVETLPKVGKTSALSNPVTSNSVSTPQEPKSVNNDKPKVTKPKKVEHQKSLATPKPRKPRFLLRWAPTGRLFDQEGKLAASSNSESQYDYSNGNLKLLINFIWKFMGTVRFGNDHVADILGFGDLQWGNILITRVYFVKGLGHNLFSVEQFCDSDLEVVFRRNACFVRNLEGADLLKGDRLPKFKYHKEHLCPSCEQRNISSTKTSSQLKAEITSSSYGFMWTNENCQYKWQAICFGDCGQLVSLHSPVIIIRTDNGIEFKNQVLKEYFDVVGISHQMSSVQTPQQNGVVKRRNWTLVEAVRTVLTFSRAPLFLRAEAIATAFIGKLSAKGDIGFFIGYSAVSCAYRVYNHQTKKIMETMNVSFDELSAMAFEQHSSKPGLNSMTSGHISSGLDLTYAPSTITTQQPSKGELDLLFEAMYDDYIGGQPSATVRTVLPAQEPQVRQSLTASTSIADTAPIPTNSSSHATNVPITSQDVDELNLNAMVDGNTFVNPFASPSTSIVTASSSQQNLDPSNMHTFYQPYPYKFQWTKDHPLEQNVKEAMTAPAWIDSRQEELLQFKRLDVWVLVPAPDNILPLTLKWIFKNKHDKEQTTEMELELEQSQQGSSHEVSLSTEGVEE
nr:hypothetical protein [Tanacetum cinerariifolium]